MPIEDFISINESKDFAQLWNKLEKVLHNYENYNLKYMAIIAIVIIIAHTIRYISYLFKYIVSVYAIIKCLLWLFEKYDTKNDETDVLECFVISIFVFLIDYLISFIPVIPLISTILYIFNTIISILSLSNAGYRREICLFIKNRFSHNKKLCNILHKILDSISTTIILTNGNIRNVVKDPISALNKLNLSHSNTETSTNIDE